MKKKSVILIVTAVIVIAAFILISFFFQSRNLLWLEAAPAYSSLTFYSCDGETTWHGNLYEMEKKEALLAELSRAGAKKANDWSPDKAEYPLYGISIGNGRDRMINAIWTNGYLLFDDGSVYRFPFDFSTIRERCEWDEESNREYLNYLPNGRFLAQGEKGWNTEFMVPSRFEPLGNEEITMELASVENHIVTVALANQSNNEWSYDWSYGIDVLLDGVWYVVPTMPDQELLIPSIAIILPAGKTQEESYSLSVFGDLPAGIYRLRAAGMSVEFTLD